MLGLARPVRWLAVAAGAVLILLPTEAMRLSAAKAQAAAKEIVEGSRGEQREH